MSMSIERKRHEVQASFDTLYELADGAVPDRLEAFERQTWAQMLACCRALTALYLARRAARPRAVRYEYAGRTYGLVGTETREVATRFGKVEYDAPVGRLIETRSAARDLPLDRELGLCAGFSLVVVMTLTKLCAQMAFAAARRTFGDLFEWMPSQRATLRMVDAVGAEARRFLEDAPPPENDGDVLVILADGKGAPAISSREYKRRARPHRQSKSGTQRHQRRDRRREHPRPRRTSGKKSKNAKMAAVGVIYTLRRTESGLEGPINKRTYATFESYRALFEWLLREAKKRGYGTAKFKTVLFVADGAKVLWDLQVELFPDAQPCLDWYHVVEKLWKTGKALHRSVRKDLEDWIAVQKKRLRCGQLDDVLAELRAILDATPLTGPGNRSRRAVLEKTLAHFSKHAARMQYHRLRRQDLDIGSGVVEGAVRHLVGVRLDGPGMRWSRDRMEAVLVLRCVLINGQWDAFEQFLSSKARVVLASQPTRTRTHDAVVKKAA